MKDSGRNLALFLLRLSGLYLALGHGWGKISGLLAGTSKFPDGLTEMGFPMPLVFAWIAALTEVVGGLFIATGLFTRVAALFAGFTMFVAAFVAHKFVQGTSPSRASPTRRSIPSRAGATRRCRSSTC